MATGNRRKRAEAVRTVASTGSTGSLDFGDSIANADKVTFYVSVTTATAGSMVMNFLASPDDGVTSFTLPAAYVEGSSTTITATGAYMYTVRTPVAIRLQLLYVITTGPFAFTVTPVYEKAGSVY